MKHNGPPLWMKIGKCHHELGDLEAARDCYEAGQSSFTLSTSFLIKQEDSWIDA